jgi:hypothetical protein
VPPPDTTLGFLNSRSRRAAVTLDNVKRRRFVHQATTLGMSALVLDLEPLLEGGEPTPTHARVGATDIEQTHIAKEVFQSWDYAYGGPGRRDGSVALVGWELAARTSCAQRCSPR